MTPPPNIPAHDQATHDHGRHGHHWLWMLICCLAPVALLLLLPLLGIQLSGLLAYAPAAICAALMLFMMFGMRHGDAPAAQPAAYAKSEDKP